MITYPLLPQELQYTSGLPYKSTWHLLPTQKEKKYVSASERCDKQNISLALEETVCSD